jgi:hypothetical protein
MPGVLLLSCRGFAAMAVAVRLEMGYPSGAKALGIVRDVCTG